MLALHPLHMVVPTPPASMLRIHQPFLLAALPRNRASSSRNRASSSQWISGERMYSAQSSVSVSRLLGTSKISRPPRPTPRITLSGLATTCISHTRSFAHLASQGDQRPVKGKESQASAKEVKKHRTDGETALSTSHNPGGKEQRMQDVQIIKRLLPNIWPKGDRSTKARVLIALGLLVGGKVGD